jgi:glycerol-3-phosphate dehydrogenase
MAEEILKRINQNIKSESSLFLAKHNGIVLPDTIDIELRYCFSISYQFCEFSFQDLSKMKNNNHELLEVLVAYAVRNEFCFKLSDFLEFRFRLAIWSKNHGLNYIRMIAEIFANLLSNFDVEKEILEYEDKIKNYYSLKLEQETN